MLWLLLSCKSEPEPKTGDDDDDAVQEDTSDTALPDTDGHTGDTDDTSMLHTGFPMATMDTGAVNWDTAGWWATADTATGPIVAGRFLMVEFPTGLSLLGVRLKGDHNVAFTGLFGNEVAVDEFAPFRVLATYPGYVPVWMEGIAANQDFLYATWMLKYGKFNQLHTFLGETADPTKGSVAVQVTDSLGIAPEPFGTASIDANYGTGFIVESNAPVLSTTISLTSDPFVSFTNVDAGPVNITVTAPGKDCKLGPAYVDPIVPATVVPGHITSVWYICK